MLPLFNETPRNVRAEDHLENYFLSCKIYLFYLKSIHLFEESKRPRK